MEELATIIVKLYLFVILLTNVDAGLCNTNSYNQTQKKCQLSKRETERITCTGDPSFLLLNEEDTKRWKYEDSVATLRILVACNLPVDDINPNFLRRFPKLSRLSIINSGVTRFTKNFPFHRSLMTLNLTRLRLTTITAELFTMLKSLKTLDISHNRIKYLNQIVLKSFNNLQDIYLKGNEWDCTKDMKWLLSTKNSSLVRKVLDAEQMMCNERKYFGKPASPVMRFIKALEGECPARNAFKKCSCRLDNVVWSQHDSPYLMPLITVNCSGLGWTHLPKKLPRNTTILLLNNNEIKDISPLITNSQYRSLSDINLDYNKIKSIDNLEAAEWLSKFRIFSIRSNKLTTLPAYAFDNAFRRNFNIGQMYLGNNLWLCDCFFTPSFKELILKYRIIIKDIYDIRCALKEGDENSLKTIHNLNLRKLCQEPQKRMRAVDLINIILVVLIILLLGHFLYSYWVYKLTGELPWIAMKIP